MSNLSANAIRILGSSNLLGDPVSFSKTLGTGVDEFWTATKDVKGIMKGTGSLAKGVAGSISGSLGKITSSVNKGVLILSADKDYQQEK